MKVLDVLNLFVANSILHIQGNVPHNLSNNKNARSRKVRERKVKILLKSCYHWSGLVFIQLCAPDTDAD